jgi:predicted DNA-binding transcriptional regulator YafY
MNEQMSTEWVAILTMAARRRKQVIIQYTYLDEPVTTVRVIEPISWQSGRKGIHVLAHSPEDEGWRRFAIQNLTSVALTTYDYTCDLKVEIK